MRIRQKITTATLILTLATSSAFALFPTGKSEAVSSSSWQAGRIIDDSIFFNSSTYNANQVQAFLNAKLPVCDTNGSKPYGGTTRAAYGTSVGNPPPYICLKDYVTTFPTIAGDQYCPGGLAGGTKSAAQIIAETAANCDINPQVILVTLQKEQSLITDDWPWQIQYQKATGFACPDTAPCDPAYAGFAKQVFYGARQFQKYSQRPDLFPNYRPGRTSRIYYNPNAGCGYSDVYVQTQATTNLYIYTPYQPNAATLAAAPGQTVNCGAYGNINFWRMFNNWFGPTVGPLVRTTTSPSLYYSDGTKKYSVSSLQLAEQYGLGLNDIRYVSQAELDSTPNAAYPLSQVVKSDSDSDEDGGALYLVSGGRRSQFSSMQQFADYGFETSQISLLPIGSLFRLQADMKFLSNFAQAPNLFVYKIEDGQKRSILDLDTYRNVNPSGQLTPLSDFALHGLPSGQPYVIGDAILHRDDKKLWLYQEGSWFYIPSMEVYGCWGFGSIPNHAFTNVQAVAPSNAPTLSCLTERANGSRFLMNQTNKIVLNDAWGFAGFSKPLDRTIDRLGSATVPAASVWRSSASPTLYVMENGKKRPLPDMATFSALGYNESSIITVSSNLMHSVLLGTVKYASGTLLKDDPGRYYVVQGNDKLYITAGQIFEGFGYNYTSAANPGSAVLSFYPTSGNLKFLASFDSQPSMIESKTKWSIPSSIQAHYGINGSTPAYSTLLLHGVTANKTATRFLKQVDSPTIYYLENGQKRPINSWAKLVELGGNGNVITISAWALGQFPTGAVI